MSQISVISKLTGVETTTESTQITLDHSSIVKLHLERSDIEHFTRSNNDLVITLHSGETITIKNFYLADGEGLSQLVLEESNGALWWVEEPATALHYESIESTDMLLAAAATGADSTTGGAIWPWVLGGIAAAGGVALAAGGGGGGGGGGSGGGSDPSNPGQPSTPDTTAPAACYFRSGR
jgi:hypothetical protein